MNISTKRAFASLVTKQPNKGCWLWTVLSCQPNGYGQIKVGRKTIKAHRLAFELYRGPIPKGMCVCHKCDVKSCVNPSHLFLGTFGDNNRDMMRKGRHYARRGEDHGMARLTREEVRKIRSDPRAQRRIGKDYGIAASQVNKIKKKRQWAWLR